ncbi:hypothetical protein FGO68_gene10024 [Halteria grandinella]|uniref:Uncharacterized protein n=1 Tax=Halteria grandinella TaxID=5974 RepID=A0A8J8NYF6_HALGN|nr:hypothetical protein FGO68_gene10024 [Halteria grandinella]
MIRMPSEIQDSVQNMQDFQNEDPLIWQKYSIKLLPRQHIITKQRIIQSAKKVGVRAPQSRVDPNLKLAVGMQYTDAVDTISENNHVLESCRSYESDLPASLYDLTSHKHLFTGQSWKLPDIPERLSTDNDFDSPQRRDWRTMHQRECAYDLPPDPIDIDAFVDEGMPEGEIQRREMMRVAQQVPTDSDIDEEVRGEPSGIDDDDEIDAGVTTVTSQLQSQRQMVSQMQQPGYIDFVIIENYEDDFDRL